MKLRFERFEHINGVQVVEQGGEKFYDLAGILNVLGMKPSWKNGMEKPPVPIHARIVWGLRQVAENYIESVFIDADAAHELVKRYWL